MLAAACTLTCPAGASAQQVTLDIERLDGPSFSARKVTATLAAQAPAMRLVIGEITIAAATWRNVRINCPVVRREKADLVCDDGVLEGPARVPLVLRYSPQSGSFDVALKPGAGEQWRVVLDKRAPAAPLTVLVSNGLLARLSPWMPANGVAVTAGSVTGLITVRGENEVAAELAITELAFADKSGLHAGEKIAVTIKIEARRQAASWQWSGRVTWLGGDVYWHPVFLAGASHTMQASGTLDEGYARVEQGALSLTGIGDVDFSLRYDRGKMAVTHARMAAPALDAGMLYTKLLKPALEGTAAGDLRTAGRIGFSVDIVDGAPESAQLRLDAVTVEDAARRFALFELSGLVPWHREQSTVARLKVGGGELLRVPFGAFDLPLDLRGIRARTRDVRVPVLDGALLINDFATSGERGSWRWRFDGAMSPISMERLTAALALPVMHGTLSAEIPTVTYDKSTLRADGTLLFNIFDGTVLARNLVLEDPLSRAPRLYADVEMRRLDLELLTRAFSFGTITGRIDADIKGLALANWEPVRFDARVASSAGNYPKRISQAAVQNISSLGGAGAGAAIQRSFLRFFDQFGYSGIGLTCRLEQGVCRMGGIEEAASGYVIVKGGGIPAINVMGYNRNVGWTELVNRLKRVTSDNIIIK